MKKIIKNISILSFLLLTQAIIAQVNIDLRPAIKSPEVTKFEQYLNMPVNLVSGTPQVSIPIYTLNYNGMTLPISLEYDASGVKIEDISSSVGLKWSLNVGGVVSRIVKGAPDEGNLYGSVSSSLINTGGYYKDYGLRNLNPKLDSFYAPAYVNEGTLSQRYAQIGLWFSDVHQGYKDSQPDLFYFSTPEGSSKFVFNDNRQIVYIENTDFFVKENYANGQFASWNLTSPTGIGYKFGANNENEKSVITSVNEVSFDSFQYQTNSWFLNEITNYATNDKIAVEYIDNSYSNIFLSQPSRLSTTCINVSQNPTDCSPDAHAYVSFAQSPYSPSQGTPEDFFSEGNSPTRENHIKSKLISKIIAGKTEINFIYGGRLDIAPDNLSTTVIPKKLDEIRVIYNGQCVKKFKFNYSYTTSDN